MRAGSGRDGFSLYEVLVVVAILAALTGLAFPLVSMLKDSSRRQQAREVISQISDALLEYQSEDPQRNYPSQEPDLFIRMSPGATSFHLLNALTAMHLDGGMQTQVPDVAANGTLVLVDPWRRPYRYQLDNAGSSSPTQAVSPTRPDPARLDWNSKGYVPFGYVWSLGRPVHGAYGQWSGDPDAVAGSGAAWIYPATAP